MKRPSMLVRVFLLLFGFLLVLGAVTKLVEGPFEFSSILLLVLGLVFLFGFYALSQPKHEKARPEAFLKELVKNRGAITNGGWKHEGMLFTPDTVITQYCFTVSVGIATFKVPSRFYVQGRENTGLVNTAYSLGTFLLGWWGIPWGPIYTVQTLYSNLRGGNRVRVGNLVQS